MTTLPYGADTIVIPFRLVRSPAAPSEPPPAQPATPSRGGANDPATAPLD